MEKVTVTVVRMDYAEQAIDEAFERITKFKQSPDDVKKYLLSWLHEFDFEAEIDCDYVNHAGYYIGHEQEGK